MHSSKMKNRVVVTGLGVVSSIGVGREEFWKNLISGKSGISKVEGFDTSAQATHFGGEIKNFEFSKYIKNRQANLMGRASQLAVVATHLALEDAGLTIKDIGRYEAGISIGTTGGEAQEIEEIDKIWATKGEGHVDVKSIRHYSFDNIPSNLGNFFNIGGPVRIFTTACAAGNYSIGYGVDMMQKGKIRKMIVGGSDAFSYLSFTGFNQLGAVAPEKCQPFDKNRKGMMVGEGAGIMILEVLEDALKRKANIYAEILGYGLSCDAHHITNPRAEGIAQCMLNAVKQTDIKLDDIDYVCAHGTGTKHNDAAESAGITKVFKEKTKDVPVSSVKSMLGHTMGAASAIEAINCCLVVKNDIIPPTINHETHDPECDIDCVPNKARSKKVDIALNNGFAFGGNNSCLVVKKY
jgi:3-oxoacyl-[acyl-carrier-protein] synthase II